MAKKVMMSDHPILKDRKDLRPLGSHTCIGHLHDLGRWKDIPYLRENEGMLPPFIVAVGSRVRVAKAPEVMKLKDPVFIDEAARTSVGLSAYGRVAMVIGMFEKFGIQVPIAVVETQMGCPATQINLRETFYHARADGYVVGSQFVKSDGIYAVRAGTAAGVNSFAPSEVQVRIGDILIATESYGSIGALIQSTLKMLNYTGGDIAGKADALRRLLSEFGTLRLSHDFQNINSKCSPRLVHHLQRAADALRIINLVGPNFTKDSLYAEIGEEGFAMLRDTYGVISTEMEQPVLDVLAAEFRRGGVLVYSALVSAAIGAIPGKSFPETARDKKFAAQAETNALLIAVNALSNIAHSIAVASHSEHKTSALT